MATDKISVPALFSKRWILAYIAMLGFCILYAMRVNMSVAIICMVRNSRTNSSTTSGLNESSCSGQLSMEENYPNQGEFDWDKSVEAIILSAFFYGYILPQIVGGWFAGQFGGRLILGGGILITSLANILIPVSARLDYRIVVVLRAVMGFFQGVVGPTMQSMWGRWAPPLERTRLSTFAYMGGNLGTIITLIGAGYLCAEGFDNGWGSIFYITGGVGVLWCIAWFCLVSNSPDSHPTITEAEKNYIIQSIGNTLPKKSRVPWRQLLTSRALLVCLIAHCCNDWLHNTLLTGLPMFMKEVLKFDIKENGVLSSTPYMAKAVSCVCIGHVADYLRSHWLSTTATRRLLQSISFIFSGILIIGVGFIPCEYRNLTVVLLAVTSGFQGMGYGGYMANYVDVAPRYAGILYGITNTLSSIPGILAPIVIGTLTPNKSQEEWRYVFFLCGAFVFIGAFVFGCFADGETQSWAKDDDENDDENESDLEEMELPSPGEESKMQNKLRLLTNSDITHKNNII